MSAQVGRSSHLLGSLFAQSSPSSHRVGLGLPGALTLGVRAGGPEVSFRHRDRRACGELLFKIQPHPPFEAESGAGETPPPRGEATSNREKALSPEVHAGWGGKGLTGNCSL